MFVVAEGGRVPGRRGTEAAAGGRRQLGARAAFTTVSCCYAFPVYSDTPTLTRKNLATTILL